MTVPPLCQALSRVDHASTPFIAFWGQYYQKSAALCSALVCGIKVLTFVTARLLRRRPSKHEGRARYQHRQPVGTLS